jgi:hypothetical protein
MRRARRWGYVLTSAVAVAGIAYIAWGPLRRWLKKQGLRWNEYQSQAEYTASQRRASSSVAREVDDQRLLATAGYGSTQVPPAVAAAFQVFRQQYETNKKTMAATVVSLCGLLQHRLERFFDIDGIIRKLRSGSNATESSAASESTDERATEMLWKQLTILSLTRVLTAAYVYCLLQGLVCVQVNLLGRYLSLATALARSERTRNSAGVTRPLPSEQELLAELLALPGASQAQPTRQVQRTYLRLGRKLGDANFLETLVTAKLMQSVRDELDGRNWDLQTPLRVGDLAAFWERVWSRLEQHRNNHDFLEDVSENICEQDTNAMGSPPLAESVLRFDDVPYRKGLWMTSILQQLVQTSRQSLVEQLRLETLPPETSHQRTTVLAEAAFSDAASDTAFQQAALQLHALLDETLDVIDSLDFVEFLEAIFDGVWRQMMRDLERTLASPEVDASLALLKWLPKCASTSRQVFADESYLRAAREAPTFERFAALVFLSGEKEASPPIADET